MKRRVGNIMLTAVLAGAMVLGSAGCGKTDGAQTAGGDKTLKDVTVVLDYVPNTNHTGMYIALEKGYYAEEGLNVEIIEPTDSTASTLIAEGKGQFGISYQEDVTFAHLTEDPIPVKAIAQIIPHNPSGIVALADSGIESPADFEGKTFAGWGGAGEAEMLHAMMDHAGSDFSKLNMIISDGAGFEALGKGVDLLWFYEAWDCVIADMNGCELNFMKCSDMDDRLDYYTTMIITSDDMIENDPETIKAFLRATEKGYMDCIADPDAGAELMAKYCVDCDIEMLKTSQNILAKRFMEGIDRWGVMEDETWNNYIDFLVEYDVIDEPVDPSVMYTNQFFE